MNNSIKGYIYIFSNTSFEYVKIGYSDRDPIIRLEELNTTGVPTPFVFEFSALVYKPKSVEKLIHRELSNYRLNPDREFFTLPVNRAVVKIKEIMQLNNISIMFEESRSNVSNSNVKSNQKQNTSSDSWPFATSASGNEESNPKEKNNSKKKNIPDEAFLKPLTPSKELAAIIGYSPLPRTEVVTKLWTYIKENDLQDRVNKRNINTDVKLKAIFGKSQITMFELASGIGKHLSD